MNTKKHYDCFLSPTRSWIFSRRSLRSVNGGRRESNEEACSLGMDRIHPGVMKLKRCIVSCMESILAHPVFRCFTRDNRNNALSTNNLRRKIVKHPSFTRKARQRILLGIRPLGLTAAWTRQFESIAVQAFSRLRPPGLAPIRPRSDQREEDSTNCFPSESFMIAATPHDSALGGFANSTPCLLSSSNVRCTSSHSKGIPVEDPLFGCATKRLARAGLGPVRGTNPNAGFTHAGGLFRP